MDDLTELLRRPNPVDQHVGVRLRLRRKEMGVSQERLADLIGLTFQQVQKYERATNRISASKLWEVARVLQAPVSYFYEGLDMPQAESEACGSRVHEFLMTAEGVELARLFPRIPEGPVRRRLLDLVRAIAEA